VTKLLDQEVSKMRRKSGHIRDCPEGRDGTKEDGENRIAYEFSHTSALLTELRCAVGPLCDALGCYETDVAALKYAAPPKGSLDVGRQPLHRDFNPECIARLREKVRRKGLRIVTPWTLLVAFTPGAKMYFLTGSTMTIVVLHRPGDAVLFRGDVLHGGASYQVDHWRCHFYLEPRAEVYAPLRGQQTFRHLKSEDNKPDVLTLFSVEKHVEEGGSWSMGADEPPGFVLWMVKGMSVDGAIEIVKTGALVV
jgi:hypothetical protein